MGWLDVATVNPNDPAVVGWANQIRDNVRFLRDKPGCSLTHSADQSIPDSAWTAFECNTELDDVHGMHLTDTATNRKRTTIPVDGRYTLVVTGVFDANATGLRGVGMRVQSSGLIVCAATTPPSAGGVSPIVCAVRKRKFLAAGTVLEHIAYQSSGAALSLLSRSEYSPLVEITFDSYTP